MIPKIIHYCWFGGNPLPQLALECIASWRRYLPDYEIRQWDESNFDVNSIPYTAEAYRQGKYAYVSDYARFEIIYKYGGIYFDTDVEVIRPLDDIASPPASIVSILPPAPSLSREGNPRREGAHYGFMGFEQDPDGVNTPGRYAPRFCFDVALGLGFGMTKGHPFMKQMMEHYQGLKFEPIPTGDIAWYKTVVAYTTEILCSEGLGNVRGVQVVRGKTWGKGCSVTVYPSEYFAPINAISRRLHITENTRTIHRYMSSWSEQKDKGVKDYIRHYLPEWVFFVYNRVKRRRYKVK